MAELVFMGHARDQMRARQIPEPAVYHVIEFADDALDRDDGCSEYIGMWDGRRLLVVLCGDEEPYRVRTVIDKTRGRPR